jgi:hypothetical protein
LVSSPPTAALSCTNLDRLFGNVAEDPTASTAKFGVEPAVGIAKNWLVGSATYFETIDSSSFSNSCIQ